MRISAILAFIGLALGLILPGFHSAKIQIPQSSSDSADSCGFVTNIYGKRLSWKGQIPIAMSLHQSVPKEMIPVIQRAMDKWEQALGKKIFYIEDKSVSGSKSLDSLKDGRNTIYVYNKGEWFGRPQDQAKTYISWVGDQIQEADVVINSENHKFSVAAQVGLDEVDLESTMIHEFGHVLGLNHEDQRPSVMATWLASGQERRSVHKGDVASVQCEY